VALPRVAGLQSTNSSMNALNHPGQLVKFVDSTNFQ
jgi:hypothetical protein